MKSKRCIQCGRVAMTITEEEYKQKTKAFYRFIATKYCMECADWWRKHNRESADRSYRARKKLIEKRLKERVCLTQEYAENLREQNRKLKDENHKLKMQIKGYD